MSNTVPPDAFEKMQDILAKKALVDEDTAVINGMKSHDFSQCKRVDAQKNDASGKVDIYIYMPTSNAPFKYSLNDTGILSASIGFAVSEAEARNTQILADIDAEFEALKSL